MPTPAQATQIRSGAAAREPFAHEPTLTEVERAYGRYAPVYDLVFGLVLHPGRRALARAVAARCGEQGARLLEIGVGTGLTLPLYPPSMAITGVDVSEPMLAKARRRARSLGRPIRLELSDGERLPFPDASFDVVTLPYVLSVTPTPARLVSEARRVCGRGGTLFVLNHFSGSRFWWSLERLVRPLANRIGFRSDFSLEEHVLSHDWKVLEVKAVNLFGLSRLVTIRNR
ncbi:MAG TPA: class I SAM-dependent methyltransferase [Usitatibacter sp.]|jgi:phosphatidylethanolamine/phosphatidyl-N-methylethanolamine N-methyltransferase|nr:class I SAM-dependent methyltransferase [Usitatibacter sp.]